jgi:photosystem II CP43 chlorophyll apoprotein
VRRFSGGDVRLLLTQLQTSVLFWLLRSPFGGDGWICSVDNLEDIIGGHIWIGTYVSVVFGTFTQPMALGTSLVWSGEAYLSYSLAAIAVMASQLVTSLGSTTQLTQVNSMVQQVLKLSSSSYILSSDQRLGANVASAQGPTGLGKYLMRSPTGESFSW